MTAPWLEKWTAHQQGYDKRPDGGFYGSLSFGELEDSVYATTLERAQLAAAAPALVRALLECEWGVEHTRLVDDGDGYMDSMTEDLCPGCQSGFQHASDCPVDAALTQAGLPCQRSRDAARKAIAEMRR